MPRYKAALANNNVRLGNRVILDITNMPINGIPTQTLAEYFRPNDWGVVMKKGLLRASLNDVPPEQRGPGSWQLTLQGKVLLNDSPEVRVAPLVACIEYGNGTQVNYIEVDAWNTSFSIPGELINISVGWSRLGSSSRPANPLPRGVFSIVEVVGTLNRQAGISSGVPIRSHWMIPPGSPGSNEFLVPRDNQSYSWCVARGTQTDTSFIGWNITVLNDFSTSALGIDGPEPSEITNMIRRQCFRPIPSEARSFYAQGPTEGDIQDVALLAQRIAI